MMHRLVRSRLSSCRSGRRRYFRHLEAERKRSRLDPHVRKVPAHLCFELLQLGVEVSNGLGVAFAKLLGFGRRGRG